MAKRTSKVPKKKTIRKSAKPPTSPPPTKRRSTWNIRSAKPPQPSGDHPIEFIARGLWLHGSRVLLCQNLDKEYYYLPGGHIEFAESAAAAVEREFLEESGLKVTAGQLLLITEGAFQTKKRRHHEFNLIFACGRRWDGSPSRLSGKSDMPPTIRSREKHIGFEWVDLAAAVDLDIRPLSIKAWLASGCSGSTTPEWISEIPANPA